MGKSQRQTATGGGCLPTGQEIFATKQKQQAQTQQMQQKAGGEERAIVVLQPTVQELQALIDQFKAKQQAEFEELCRGLLL